MAEATRTSTHWQSGPLPWQRQQMDRLAEQHRQGRLPHALLLAGPEGIGKTWFAAAVSAGLLCSEARQMQPCGRCDACQQAMAGSHGDQRWVEVLADKDKKAIGIDQVRDAITFVQKTAGYGQRKVLVVNPAEKMTVAAANALLKTLEEPSADTLLILVSHQPWLLPITVRSRCQQWAMPSPEDDQLRRWLTDAGVATEALDDLIRLGGGRPLSALAMADLERREQREKMDAVWQALLSGRAAGPGASESLKNIPPETALQALQQRLEFELRTMDVDPLKRRGTRLLLLHRLVGNLLKRMRSGANPGRDVLIDNVCSAASAVNDERGGAVLINRLGAVLGIAGSSE